MIQETDICNYADDTTIYTCDIRLENVISRLENDSKVIIEWFRNDYMKLYEDKCHFMIFGERTNQDFGINIGNCTVNNSQEEKLLGVLIDSNLNFEKHVSNICKKAGNKLFTLSRMSTYLGTDKLRLLMRAFFFIQYKNFTKTNYLRLHLQTTGLHNKDDDPGKQEPMTIPKGHYIKH